MDYITIKEAAEKWHLSVRRVQDMCKAEIIPGTVKVGHAWAFLIYSTHCFALIDMP